MVKAGASPASLSRTSTTSLAPPTNGLPRIKLLLPRMSGRSGRFAPTRGFTRVERPQRARVSNVSRLVSGEGVMLMRFSEVSSWPRNDNVPSGDNSHQPGIDAG